MHPSRPSLSSSRAEEPKPRPRCRRRPRRPRRRWLPPIRRRQRPPARRPSKRRPRSRRPWPKWTGLSTPESVFYDADADRYLVSNINGKPDGKDNNGFISVLSPDGTTTTPKWIEGGKEKVKLDAPKGMGVANGVLYVADISVVRMFDAKTGAPKGDVAIPGATFLNDIATGPDGKVYVSDTGVKVTAKGFEPTGTDAV